MEDLTLSVWLVLTPNVLLLDYAGPAETLRMARDMGARIELHSCAPQVCLSTSLGRPAVGAGRLVAGPPLHYASQLARRATGG